MRVPVSVAYGCDIELAERLMLEAAVASPRVLVNPPPAVWLNRFGTDAIEFDILVWIADPEQGLGNLRSDVLKRVWKAFNESDIRVPLSQRDLNLRDTPALRELIAAIRGGRPHAAAPPGPPPERQADSQAETEA